MKFDKILADITFNQFTSWGGMQKVLWTGVSKWTEVCRKITPMMRLSRQCLTKENYTCVECVLMMASLTSWFKFET